MIQWQGAVAVAAALLTGPANADPKLWPVGSDQVAIAVKGLALADAPGRARLLAAVTKAAEMLCRDVQPAVDRRACVADTIAKTSAKAPPGLPLPRALAERDDARRVELASLAR